jgi:hypothetical protein
MLFNPARPSLSFSSSLFFVGGFSLSTSTTDRQHTVPFKEKDRAGLGLREYQSFCAIFIKVYSSRCYYQRAPTGDGRHYIYIERERERGNKIRTCPNCKLARIYLFIYLYLFNLIKIKTVI